MAAQDPNAPTDSNGEALVVTVAAMLTLSWLSVFLRSYVRARLTNGFQWDDWIMLVAQANYTVSCALILWGVREGLGRHNRSLDQHHEIRALQAQALATATYIPNMWLIKVSIGIFLLRLASEKRRYRYTIYGTLFVVSVWSIVLFFWNIFQCNPVAAQWDYTLLKNPRNHCVSADEIVNAAYALSVMNILTDWLYALLPIPMLWRVKMTAQAKLTVIVILGLGVFASVATLVRIKFLADLTDLADILHAGTDAMVWTLVEPGVAIIASSLVTIRPLLRLWKVKGFGSTGESRITNPFSKNHPASRTNRSKKTPAFESTDETLVDVESGSQARNVVIPLSILPFRGTIHRSLSLSDAGSMMSRSSRSQSSSDTRAQRSRSISDVETLAGSKSSRSRPTHNNNMSMLFEAPSEDDERSRYDFGFESRSPTSTTSNNRSLLRRDDAKSEILFIEGNVTPVPPTPPLPLRLQGQGGTWLLEQEQGSSNEDLGLGLGRTRSTLSSKASNASLIVKPLPRLPAPSPYQRWKMGQGQSRRPR